MWYRISAFMFSVTFACLVIFSMEVEARGGGGGRGGGGSRGAGGGSIGGARSYSGGNVMNRTPTMSRSVSRPNVSSARQLQSRPYATQRGLQQGYQGRPNAADLRNQIGQYAQADALNNMNRQGLTSQRSVDFSNNRSDQISQNRKLSIRTSQRLQQSRPDASQWFNRNFFDRHDIKADYVKAGTNLWRAAPWATLATWGAWNWSTPYYYDYDGYAYPVTTTEPAYNYSYSYNPNLNSYQSSIDSGQTTSTTGNDWLPLGVFAVANNANAAAQSNRFIQLALNRNGEIAGVLYNAATDAAQDLTGKVDQNSQKAYWSLSNRTDSPIASTGIYNLTESQTPINVRFSDGSEQNWTMVRLQQ